MENASPSKRPPAPARKKKPFLGAEAWISTAWKALAREGIQGVRVEVLATRLGVTKGSFYWHFADRGALLSALLDDWEKRATLAVIERVDAASPRPRERLRFLLRDATSVEGAPAVEQAVRAWGLHDAAVRKRLARVDAKRESYVAALLEEAGVAKRAATHRARALYLALLGEYARVAHGGEPTARATWDELLARMFPVERDLA